MQEKRLEESSIITTVFGGKTEAKLHCEGCEQFSNHSHPFFCIPLSQINVSETESVIENRKLYKSFLNQSHLELKSSLFSFFKGKPQLKTVSLLDLAYVYFNQSQNCSCKEEELKCQTCGKKMKFCSSKQISTFPSNLAFGLPIPKTSEEKINLKIDEVVDFSFFNNHRLSESSKDSSDSGDSQGRNALGEQILPTLSTSAYIHQNQTHFKEIKVSTKSRVSAKIMKSQYEKPMRSSLFTSNILNENHLESGLVANKSKVLELPKKTFLYNLKCLVKYEEIDGNLPEFVLFFKRKGNWIEVRKGKQKLIDSFETIVNQKGSPVFVLYQKHQEKTTFQKSILSLTKAKGEMEKKVKFLTLPDFYLYSMLYANNSHGFTPIQYVCSHGRIRPSYEDIYNVNFSRPINAKYSKEDPALFHTKINFELENYLSSTENPTFATLRYLMLGQELPDSVVNYMEEKFNLSLTNVKMAHFDYKSPCLECFQKDRFFVMKRIVEKALVIALLEKKTAQNFLIDKTWFESFSHYLLADAPIDKFSRRNFFSYPFLKPKVSKSYVELIAEKREKYRNDCEIADCEFVKINNELFDFFNEHYKWANSLTYNHGDILYNKLYQPKTFASLSNEEKYIWSFLLAFDEKKHLVTEYQYELLIELNKKLTWIMLFRINTDYKTLMVSEILLPRNFNKKLRKNLSRYFGAKDLRAIVFDGCKEASAILSTESGSLDALNKHQINEENHSRFNSLSKYTGSNLNSPDGKQETQKGFKSKTEGKVQVKSEEVSEIIEEEKGEKNCTKSKDLFSRVELSSQKKNASKHASIKVMGPGEKQSIVCDLDQSSILNQEIEIENSPEKDQTKNTKNVNHTSAFSQLKPIDMDGSFDSKQDVEKMFPLNSGHGFTSPRFQSFFSDNNSLKNDLAKKIGMELDSVAPFECQKEPEEPINPRKSIPLKLDEPKKVEFSTKITTQEIPRVSYPKMVEKDISDDLSVSANDSPRKSAEEKSPEQNRHMVLIKKKSKFANISNSKFFDEEEEDKKEKHSESDSQSESENDYELKEVQNPEPKNIDADLHKLSKLNINYVSRRSGDLFMFHRQEDSSKKFSLPLNLEPVVKKEDVDKNQFNFSQKIDPINSDFSVLNPETVIKEKSLDEERAKLEKKYDPNTSISAGNVKPLEEVNMSKLGIESKISSEDSSNAPFLLIIKKAPKPVMQKPINLADEILSKEPPKLISNKEDVSEIKDKNLDVEILKPESKSESLKEEKQKISIEFEEKSKEEKSPAPFLLIIKDKPSKNSLQSKKTVPASKIEPPIITEAQASNEKPDEKDKEKPSKESQEKALEGTSINEQSKPQAELEIQSKSKEIELETEKIVQDIEKVSQKEENLQTSKKVEIETNYSQSKTIEIEKSEQAKPKVSIYTWPTQENSINISLLAQNVLQKLEYSVIDKLDEASPKSRVSDFFKRKDESIYKEDLCKEILSEKEKVSTPENRNEKEESKLNEEPKIVKENEIFHENPSKKESKPKNNEISTPKSEKKLIESVVSESDSDCSLLGSNSKRNRSEFATPSKFNKEKKLNESQNNADIFSLFASQNLIEIEKTALQILLSSAQNSFTEEQKIQNSLQNAKENQISKPTQSEKNIAEGVDNELSRLEKSVVNLYENLTQGMGVTPNELSQLAKEALEKLEISASNDQLNEKNALDFDQKSESIAKFKVLDGNSQNLELGPKKSSFKTEKNDEAKEGPSEPEKAKENKI